MNVMDNLALDRATRLRAALREAGVNGFVVPRADEHLGEYVPESAERLAWLTGFTGSAGMAVMLMDRAAVFSDGRYTLQLEEQTDGTVWERHHSIKEPPAAWLAETAPGARIGYDPWLISADGVKGFADKGLVMVALERNPVDQIWTDRPAPPLGAARPHGIGFTGKSSAEKRSEIGKILADAKQDAVVLTDPASVCWLLNIRGADVPFTPFVLGFALAYADGRCSLFMDPAKLPAETRDFLGAEVRCLPRTALPDELATLGGKRVRVDGAGSPSWFARTLEASGASVVAEPDPCLLPKARKNATEQEGARAAHRRDAIAMARYLHFIATEAPKGGLDEMGAADTLLGFRQALDLFRDESFPAISGAGEHGAIIHYRAMPESNRAIKPNEVYLIDSGGQYDDATTDITRTVWTGPGPAPADIRERFTRVLKGNIALTSVVFPKGVAGPHLDSFARQALWRIGLDYDHGTGHGVGSFLSVHEGPASISRASKMVPLEPGMILSNEPGFYLPGAYGIRLENLLLVQKAEFPGADREFYRFEPLTLAPFDRQLIHVALLSAEERAWLDAYHARVVRDVAGHVPDDVAAWLREVCRPL